MENIYEVRRKNNFKSTITVVMFFVFIFFSVYFISQAMGIYSGYQPGGFGYLGIALIISGITSLGSYYFSDRIILGLAHARPADRSKDFNIYTSAENLALGSGLPKPKLYVMEDNALNAFATGRNPENAVICVTRGLIDKLDRSELEGVLAHELTHVKNYDMRLMSLVAVMVGTLALLGDWFIRMRWTGSRNNDDNNSGRLGMVIMIVGILFAIISPIIAKLIQLAISRRREFMADAGSVSMTRQPQGLISALTKISADPQAMRNTNNATAHLYIANPFKNRNNPSLLKLSNLFNTHPPMKDRISALKKMA